MFNSHRVYPLWKLSPGLGALVGIVAIGLYLLGVIPGQPGAGRVPGGPPWRAAKGARAARTAKDADPPATLADLTAAIAREPNNPERYVERAAAYFERKEYDSARADYEQALRLDPENAEALFGRGYLHLQQDEDDLALADFSEVIRLAPEVAEGYASRGSVYAARQDYRRAVADFNEALRLDPRSADAYIGRGKARRDQKDYDGAVADFQQATRLEPDSPEGYNELAWVWATCPRADLRRGDLALEYAGKACQLSDWEDPLCLDTYAAAYASLGEFDQAVRWQKKALGFTDDLSETDLEELRARLKLYEEHKPYRLE
jgi:tetratricopeptide (TPR) repeat protein